MITRLEAKLTRCLKKNEAFESGASDDIVAKAKKHMKNQQDDGPPVGHKSDKEIASNLFGRPST